MAHFIFSAFSDESGESKIKGQIAACKENGVAEMELRGLKRNISEFSASSLIKRTDMMIIRKK